MGGSYVTISGSKFPSSVASFVTCRFGLSEPTLALRVSGSAFACTSPSSYAGARALSISFNSQNYVREPAFFEAFTPMVINNVLPACGPVNGGTQMVVLGGPFPQRAAELSLLTCRLGSGREDRGVRLPPVPSLFCPAC